MDALEEGKEAFNPGGFSALTIPPFGALWLSELSELSTVRSRKANLCKGTQVFFHYHPTNIVHIDNEKLSDSTFIITYNIL